MDIFEDNNLKCYMKCMMMSANVLFKNGKLDFMPIMNRIELLSPENQTIVLKAGSKCLRSPVAEELCEIAFAVQKCLKMRDPLVCISILFV